MMNQLILIFIVNNSDINLDNEEFISSHVSILKKYRINIIPIIICCFGKIIFLNLLIRYTITNIIINKYF